jgi:hypothetical protein
MEVVHAECQTAGSNSYIRKTMDSPRVPAQPMDSVSDDLGYIAHRISRYPICLDDIETNSRRKIFLGCKLKALKVIVTDILEALGNKKMPQEACCCYEDQGILGAYPASSATRFE